MSNWYDEIGQYALEKATRDFRIARDQYTDAVNRGALDEASDLLRHVRYHAQEVNELAPQPQLTQAQQAFLDARPTIRDNPKKLEALAADYRALLKAGVPDDSSEMFRLLSGRHDQKPGESEVPTPADMIDMVSRSKHFGNKEEARRALHQGWQDVQQELANRGGRWENK
jgi:hypothetical protein